MSIETWKAIADWATIVLIALTVVSGSGALILGDRINVKQSAQLAKAQKESAEAQLALRQYIDEVNRDRGPRMIIDHKAFVSALQGKPKAKVEILFNPNDEEAFELAIQIRRWLGPGADGDGAGWEVGEPKPIPPIGGDPKVSPFAPAGIKYGAMGGMAIIANRLFTPLDKNTAYDALMDALFTARLVPSGERVPTLPDNVFIIVV